MTSTLISSGSGRRACPRSSVRQCALWERSYRCRPPPPPREPPPREPPKLPPLRATPPKLRPPIALGRPLPAPPRKTCPRFVPPGLAPLKAPERGPVFARAATGPPAAQPLPRRALGPTAVRWLKPRYARVDGKLRRATTPRAPMNGPRLKKNRLRETYGLWLKTITRLRQLKPHEGQPHPNPPKNERLIAGPNETNGGPNQPS